MFYIKLWRVLGSDNERRLKLTFFILSIISLLELTGLVLVIPYVNIMLGTESSFSYIGEVLNIIERLKITGNIKIDASILFGLFYILKNTVLMLLVFFEHVLLKKTQADIYNRIFTHYVYQPFSFHLTARSSDLLRTITYDAPALTDGLFLQSATLITELLLLIGVMVVMSQQNPLAIFIIILMVVPVTAIYFYVKKYLVMWARALQEKESKLIKYLQEGLGGIKDAIISGKRSFFENNFHINVIERSQIKRKRDVALLIPRYLIETMMMLAMAATLLWLEQSKGLAASLPEIAFLTLVTVRLLPMSNRILSSLNNIKSCMPSVNVIYSILSKANKDIEKSEYLDKNSDLDYEIDFKKISLNDVHYKYSKNYRVIDNLSITIKKGEMIGIAGGSGAGKTTLVNLMLGLLVPNKGSVNVNDKNIHENLKQWQGIIGYVSQVVFLLDSSIIENIAFGLEPNEIDIKRVNRVIRLAKLDSWVNTLTDGVESIVGEQGVQISGGQRQRIGIARALYQNPEILVFDEATSSLDNLTEKEIMDDIYKMHGDRTIIIIAHRLETIRQCDRIIVLENGRVVGDDKYSSLLKNNKAFQKISLISSMEL